jgi:integrase
MGKTKNRANGDGDVFPRKNKAGKITSYRGAYVGPDGKRRYVSGKTKTDAREALAAARADAAGGVVLDAGKLTVAEYLERWLSDCIGPLVSSGKMEHSLPHHRPEEAQGLGPYRSPLALQREGQGAIPRSVDYIHVTLQKALSQAMRDNLIPRNVATGERPRSSRKREEIMALSSEQARALLSTAKGERNEALYIVAVHTGLRQGELLGLKWADLDLAGRRLSVR